MTRRAFTLIELIIATVILSAVAVSVYSAFSVGIKAWRRGSEGQDLHKTRIALLRMHKELKASFFFSKAPFKGGPSEITFPLAVPEGGQDNVRIVNYYVAEDNKRGANVLMKRKYLFQDNKPFKEKGGQEFIFSADSIDFEYAYELRDRIKGMEWKDIWEGYQRQIPLAVKINFRLKKEGDIYHKIIFIPQGVLGAQ